MIIEIGVGVAFAIGLFVLQIRMSRKVNDMTKEMHDFIKQKAELEQKYKVSQCQIIIEHLKEILQRENIAKECLNNYPVGESIDETIHYMTKFTIKNAVLPFTNKIENMKYATGELQVLNDTTLKREFLEYVGSFNYLPRQILELKILEHEKDYLRQGLLAFIKKQTPEIEEFIKRFSEEMVSSLAEKREEDQSVAREILNHRKYFNAPKL